MRRFGRRGAAGVGGLLALALVLPVAVSTSLGAWGDVEVVNRQASALDCATNTAFDSTAWGRVISSGVAGAGSLDGVAAFRGITVANTAPSTTSVATGASPTFSATNNAWTSALDLSLLSTVDIGAGAHLPLAANTGVYTQYGRATAAGTSTGASGAVTSASNGLVSLDTPTGSTPTLGQLTLSSVLSSAISTQLGANASRLSDVGLTIGAVGSTATLDACGAAWAAQGNQAGYVSRDYLISSLSLGLTSSILTAVQTAVTGALTTTESSLDALLAPGTSVTGATLTSLSSTLNSLLNISVLGIGLSGDQVDSLKIGVEFDLQPVKNLLALDLTSGSVVVNLASGTIMANLAGANGLVNLNNLPANSPLLTSTTVTKLTQDVSNAVTGLISGPLTTALTTAILNATVTVDIVTHLKATLLFVPVRVADVTIKLSGTLGAFTGVTGYGSVTPTVTATILPAVTGTLATLGINLTALTNGIATSLVTPLISTLVPALAGAVLNGVVTSATSIVTNTLGTVTTSTLPPLLAQLGPVFTLLQQLVNVTANAQPDRPNPVGIPDSTAPGTYFVSALKIGAVNPSTSASLLALFLASSSVGPNTRR